MKSTSGSRPLHGCKVGGHARLYAYIIGIFFINFLTIVWDPELIKTHHWATSGNYNIILSNGTLLEVYCDMDETNCDGTGDWTKIALLNMTEASAICLEGLVERNGTSQGIQ